MAYDATGQIGLPADMRFSDILSPSESGVPYDVVVGYLDGDTVGRGFMRGYYHESRWGSLYYFERDTVTGGWKPKDSTDGLSRQWVGEENAGGWFFVEYEPTALVDGLTAYAWDAPLDSSTLCQKTELLLRYDTSKQAWRFDAFGKGLDYKRLNTGRFVLFADGASEGVGFTVDGTAIKMNSARYKLGVDGWELVE